MLGSSGVLRECALVVYLFKLFCVIMIENNLLCYYDDYWNEINGLWSVNNSNCVLSSGRGKNFYVWLGNENGDLLNNVWQYSSFELNLKINVLQHNGASGIMFRINNLNDNKYYFYGIKPNTNILKLAYFNQATEQTIAQHFSQINYNQIYDLKIIAFNNQSYNFYFNDILIWEQYQLTQYQNGSAGIRSNWATANYYSFEYTQL